MTVGRTWSGGPNFTFLIPTCKQKIQLWLATEIHFQINVFQKKYIALTWISSLILSGQSTFLQPLHENYPKQNSKKEAQQARENSQKDVEVKQKVWRDVISWPEKKWKLSHSFPMHLFYTPIKQKTSRFSDVFRG